MGRKLHPEYEQHIRECVSTVLERLGTGTLKTVAELEEYVLEVCTPLSATDGLSFFSRFAPFEWEDVVCVELLEQCGLDLVEFIKQTVGLTLGFEVLLFLSQNSDYYRVLANGGMSQTVTLQPGTTPILFQECFRNEALHYEDCQVIERIEDEDCDLTIYELPNGFDWVYLLRHSEPICLCWIGKPVEN